MARWREYSKAIVAVAGAGVTAALGIFPPDTDLFNGLTIASAMLTAFGVYVVRNEGDDAGTAG